MMEENPKKKRLVDACAPASNPASPPNQNLPPVWSLTQMGAGTLGQQRAKLVCLVVKQLHEDGSFASQFPYPIDSSLQDLPGVSTRVRTVEFCSAATIKGKKGIVYRMHPFPGHHPSPWLNSAEAVMNSLVGRWGQVVSDHVNKEYVLHEVKSHGRTIPSLSNVEDELDRLLADYVIDRPDHPVLQELLGDSGSASVQPGTPDSGDDEEDNDVY